MDLRGGLTCKNAAVEAILKDNMRWKTRHKTKHSFSHGLLHHWNVLCCQADIQWSPSGTSRRNIFTRGLYLFILSMHLAQLVGASEGDDFHSQLHNGVKSRLNLRRIRSVKEQDDGMHFDSRIHSSLGDAVPRDDENLGDPDAAEIAQNMSYEYDDYNANLTWGGPFYAFEEMIKQLYLGPVCDLIDVRNNPSGLRGLENCTIVNGFVRIVFMHKTKESDFEQYTFPKLRVITEYLLVYRVYGLRSLRKMFPNLAVIKGTVLFHNYGLVIFENPSLQDIGLGNLRQIERGGVRIQKNSKLCYLDTVDWERLGMRGDKVTNKDVGFPVIKDNVISEDETCLDQCGEEGDCIDEPTGTANCWGHNLCQKPSCPAECPNACENDTCTCHEQCLGGCTAPNNASECLACLNRYHDGVCVPECPEGTYLRNDWWCVTRDWCLDFTWVPHEGKCVRECPPDHRSVEEDDGGLHCEYCGRSCRRDCDLKEHLVSDVESVKRLRTCVTISGRLTITVMPGDDLLKALEDPPLFLEEVGSLAIRRSESLISLNFLRNLKRITGEKSALIDGTYSLYVLDNQNLRELFPSTNNSNSDSLRIDGGKAFFHFNPKLCMKEVDKMRALTKEEEDDKDISKTTNGDRATCDMKALNILEISHMPMGDSDFAAVRVKWEKVEVADTRTLIGYQVFYKESKFKNATRFEGLYACGKSSSSWIIIDHLMGAREDSSQESATQSLDVVLHYLKPYTQYALYIRTYTTSSAQKGAQSDITYFMTEASRPTEPISVSARAINTTAIYVDWKQPYHPNGNITHYIVRCTRQEEDLGLAKRVDMCKHEKNSYTQRRIIPSQAPSVSPSKPTVGDRKRGCCTCDSGKILPSHEEEANNDANFEDFLQRSILKTPFFYMNPDYGNDSRWRRSLDDNSDEAYDGGVWESDYADYGSREDNNTREIGEIEHQVDVTMDTHITITGLHHFTEYVIQVFACNHASHQPDDESLLSMGDYAFYELTHGCSMDSLTAKRANRLPHADDIPVESFRLTERQLEGGRLQPVLAWEPPTDPNGFVKYYEVDLQQKQHDGRYESAPEYFCVSLNEFEDMNRQYIIPTHVAGGKYRARVRAVSLAGSGDWSKVAAIEIPDPTEESRKTDPYVLIVVIPAAVVISAMFLAVWCYRRKRKKDARNRMIYSSANPEYISLAANYVPDGYEVDEEDVELIKLIGQGNFGKVFLGFAKKVIKGEEKTKVAIKKLHEKAGIHRRIEFLEEAKLMKAFNSTHVVRLLGVVSQAVDPMVIIEYMEKGDLKTHLRSRREDAECDTDDRLPPPTLQERLQMAAEIADGMAYLAEIKFVHRDLAARNCLVSAEGVVKIGDFGLTRDVYETDYYRKDSRGLLPIRWMAPESLRDGVFDSQSDVWSYGVVIWEIATLAEQPYQGLPHDKVTRYVIDGGYMEKPKNCPKKLYDMMLNCWQFNPEMRPKFTEILNSLSNDVGKRFKKDSYYFEQMNAKEAEAITVLDKLTGEEMSMFNEDTLISRDDSFRIVTPLNVTPTRSRSETPCGCNTPASRNSNGSAKMSCEFSAQCDHLKRFDASAFSVVQPRGISPGLKHSSSMRNAVPRKGNSFIRKCGSFTDRSLKNASPHPKATPPSSRTGDDMYYSLSTSGFEGDFDGTSSEDSTALQVIEISPEETSNKCSSSKQQTTVNDRNSPSSSFPPPGKSNHMPKDLPNGLLHGNDPLSKDAPYAHMNGFAKRQYSQNARRHPSRKFAGEDESSYVESSPKKFTRSKFVSDHIDPKSVPPPPPPSFPPPTQPLLQS